MAGVYLEDTRQQVGKHEVKHEWWADRGITLVRSKLAFGDYCRPPEAAVDTKASIAELAMDIDREHARFRRELIGARDAGVRLYVLVENDAGVTDLSSLASWTEPDADFRLRKYAQRRHRGQAPCEGVQDHVRPLRRDVSVLRSRGCRSHRDRDFGGAL